MGQNNPVPVYRRFKDRGAEPDYAAACQLELKDPGVVHGRPVPSEHNLALFFLSRYWGLVGQIRLKTVQGSF